MDHAGLWWAWVGESLSSTQCLPLLPELPVNPWNLVHFGQAFTLRHREPLTFQVHLFWDCHSPACVPCLVGLAVAVDWLLLQPALDWTMADWADGRGPGTASGEKAPGPCFADVTHEVRTWSCASEFTDECGRCSKCREWLAGTISSLWLCFRERMLWPYFICTGLAMCMVQTALRQTASWTLRGCVQCVLISLLIKAPCRTPLSQQQIYMLLERCKLWGECAIRS